MRPSALKKRMVAGSVALTAVITSYWAISAAEPGPDIDYPDNYRSWQHVKTMIIQPGHILEDPFGGIHHVYANSKAMNGLANGRYEEGAVFVFDLLDYVESDKTIVESARKRIDVMQYDSDRFSATENWGYGTFVGDSQTERLQQDVVTACFNCHMAAKNSNFVYSQYKP